MRIQWSAAAKTLLLADFSPELTPGVAALNSYDLPLVTVLW